jgi:hypothetical protein
MLTTLVLRDACSFCLQVAAASAAAAAREEARAAAATSASAPEILPFSGAANEAFDRKKKLVCPVTAISL